MGITEMPQMRRKGGGDMTYTSRVLRWLFFALLVIAAAEAFRGFIWLLFAFCHDMAAARYGWPLLLLG